MATVLEKQNYDKELHEEIKNLIDTKKVDITTIARGINKSPTTVSLYLSKKYNGRIDNLEEDLRGYLNIINKREKADFKSLKFVETTIVKRLFNAANMCQLRGKMGVCYGSPGIGKTTTIQEYQKSSASVIIVDPCEQTSSRAILIQIAKQLKLSYSNNMSTDEFIDNISKKLYKNKYLIIVDEAENLKIDSFKALRKIFDRAKNSCGLLFVGTEELQDLLMKVKHGFPYISSRIAYLERLDALKIGDVEKLVIQYFPDCTDSLIQYIAKTCNYNARAIQNLLDLCLDIVQSNKIILDTDVIDAAREKLLI